jgi:hypothetical protein
MFVNRTYGDCHMVLAWLEEILEINNLRVI